MVTDFERAMRVLTEGGVQFIVVGGVAGTLHGSAFITQDLDVVYSRGRETFSGWQPRCAPASRIFAAHRKACLHWDEKTIRNGLNFTLNTSFGDLDLLGETTGAGGYSDLLPHSQEISGFGVRFRLVNLDKLIVMKRAAGRPKDLAVIAELQGILERKQQNHKP